MKPYITFTLDFDHRVGKSTLMQYLMGICPFDHLSRNIEKIRKEGGTSSFEIQVFFQNVEYLEAIYQQLQKKSIEMEELLNSKTNGTVSNVEIGVVPE